MSTRHTLMRIIKHYQLDYRFSKWADTLSVIKLGLYDDAFCEIFIPEAEHDAEAVEKQGNFLPQPADEQELNGQSPPDIELGTAIESDCRMGICYKNRPRNTVIFGSAGSGKTVTCRKILQEIDAQNIKHPDNPTLLWIMDLKADNQDLPQLLKGNVLQVSLSDNLRIGPNGPPNVPPYLWIAQVSISLAIRLGLVAARTCLAGIITMLLGALNQGLSKTDLTDPKVISQLTWPSLAMVLDTIKIKKLLDLYSSKASYGQTLIQALTGLLQDSGKLFECSEGLNLDKEVLTSKKHLCIAGSNIPSYILHLVNDYLINYVMVPRLFHNYKCDHTDIVFGYDEADILLESDFEAAFSDGLSPLSRLNRLGREMGLMSLISLSAPQAASEHILRSAYYTFGFSLSDARSIHAAVHHLQLDPRCSRMISSLPPGQCIFRQTQASWSQALWCKMDFVPPARNLGRVHYPRHYHSPAIRLAEAPNVVTHLKAYIEEGQKSQRRLAEAVRPQFELLALQLLKQAADSPYRPVARIMAGLGKIAPKTQIALRQYLETEGYATFAEPRIGRTNMLLIELTPKGYQTLGLPRPKGNKGRGSITHRHYAHWIKRHFEKQGYPAFIEWVAPGTRHPVDIAVQVNDQWVAIEITVTATENLLSHIQVLFEQSTRVDKLIIVAGTKKELTGLKIDLQGTGLYLKIGSRIVFDVIQNYMGEL
ncbi:hypothetical protein ACFL6U_12190 [Planctomycetota bacterium]